MAIITRRPDCVLVSCRELAQMLSLSPRTVWRLLSAGKIPRPIRIGGSIRWAESTILAWLQADAPDRKTWEAINSDKR